MVTLTAETLRDAAACSLVTARTWVPHINQALYLFAIDAPQRAAAFLAQISHESQQFTRLRESLHYSTPQRLCAVWPTRFPNVDAAAPYVGQPERLGDKVYGGRMGNTQPGDGLRYCGRGLIQVTGRAGCCAARDGLRDPALGLSDVPDFEASPSALELPHWAALSAGLYWRRNKLNALADRGDTAGITRIVNGGLHGLAEREALYRIARRSLMGVR
jgi:putative chitinase